jgi:hypothetical protein
MALDVVSLNSGQSGRVHDSEHEGTDGSARSYARRSSMKGSSQVSQTMSMRSITVSMRNLADKEAKRRRRQDKLNQDKESSTDPSVKKKKRERKSKSTRDNNEKSAEMDALENGRTEHTSNLTDHSREFRRGMDQETTCKHIQEDSNNSVDDFTCNGNDADTLGGETDVQSMETRESRFQSLLNQWRTRENKQKRATETNDAGSRVSYLSEDEDRSCFEGVMKHWKKRDDGSIKEKEDARTTVFVEDDTSDISSLGDSLRWGYESDSRFDFGYDARFDGGVCMSPPMRTKSNNLKGERKKKDKKKEKKDGTKSKKKAKKEKSSDVSVATFDASEAAMDTSIATLETLSSKTKKKKNKKKKSKTKKAMDASAVAVEASEVATVGTLESTASKIRKKKKSNKYKTKSSKPKRHLGTSFATLDNTDGAPGSEATETTEGSSEELRCSEEEGSKGGYASTWLTPTASPKKSVEESLSKGTPTVKKIPLLPNLLENDEDEKQASTSDLSAQLVPFLPNMLPSPTTERKRPDP